MMKLTRKLEMGRWGLREDPAGLHCVIQHDGHVGIAREQCCQLRRELAAYVGADDCAQAPCRRPHAVGAWVVECWSWGLGRFHTQAFDVETDNQALQLDDTLFG